MVLEGTVPLKKFREARWRLTEHTMQWKWPISMEQNMGYRKSFFFFFFKLLFNMTRLGLQHGVYKALLRE
jgi:hypothetical protein